MGSVVMSSAVSRYAGWMLPTGLRELAGSVAHPPQRPAGDPRGKWDRRTGQNSLPPKVLSERNPRVEKRRSISISLKANRPSEQVLVRFRASDPRAAESKLSRRPCGFSRRAATCRAAHESIDWIAALR